MRLRCFDPGNTIGFAEIRDSALVRARNSGLASALAACSTAEGMVVVIERMTPRAIVGKDMLRGAEIFGALAAFAHRDYATVYGIPRPTVCTILTGSARAKKGQVKEAVLALTGPKPRAKDTEVAQFWGDYDRAKQVTAHAWDAVALGLAWLQLSKEEREKYRWTPSNA